MTAKRSRSRGRRGRMGVEGSRGKPNASARARRTDPDDEEWTAEDFRRARPLRDAAPELAAAMEAHQRAEAKRRGRMSAQTLDALRQRVAALERLCGEAYQLAGAVGAPVRFLDALAAAANGDPISEGDRLPVTADECVAPAVPMKRQSKRRRNAR